MLDTLSNDKINVHRTLQDAKVGTHRLNSPAEGSSWSYRTKALMMGSLISLGSSQTLVPCQHEEETY